MNAFTDKLFENDRFIEKLATNNKFIDKLSKTPNFVIGLVNNSNFVNILVKNPNFRITLVKNPDFKEDIMDIADEFITSEQIFDKLDEIPELKQEILDIKINGKVIIPASEDTEAAEKIIVSTKKGYIGYQAVKFLCSLPDDIYGEKTLTTKLFYKLLEQIPEEFRPKTENIRQAKSDIYNFVESFYKSVKKDNAKRGNKDSVLVMKKDFDSSILNRIVV